MAAHFLYLGFRIILTENNSNDAIFAALAKDKVDILVFTPIVLNRLLQASKGNSQLWQKYGPNLKWCISTGENLSADLSVLWHKCTGAVVINLYASNETRVVRTSGEHKPGSIGKPCLPSEVEILDNDCNPLPPDTLGNLAVRGVGGCIYWNRKAAQAETVKNGWTIPGDLAKKDTDGYIWYLGRKNDLISFSDGNMFLPNIEAILQTHEHVKEVAVVDVEVEALNRVDGRLTIIKAFVVPNITESTELSQLAANLIKHVVEHRPMWERVDQVEFVSSIPLFPNGKIDRKTLRNQAKMH
jgi:2-aminobenzoate-CoA ligase